MTADGNAAIAGAGDSPQQPASELKMLGRYQIERKLGAGGMGTVFLARDTQLKRVVALKVLSRDKAQNQTLVKRFKSEAQAAAQLKHDNIVAVYDSGESDGHLFIAMEYVEGQDLFEMVQRRGVVPVKRSIEIIKQVASALQHAYEQNIVHRDIKPSNLLIARNGAVKLTDLGLARSVDDTLETNITRAGTTVGTVDYMSPEQGRNSKLADIRSDLYSLGCTWYQMLTGEPPYPDGSVTNKLQAHASKPIPDPRDLKPNIPEGVIAVLHRLMAKKPEDRYQTPAELLDDLQHATLTQAAISREILGGLSDYDQKTVRRTGSSADDGDEDDYDDEPDHSRRQSDADAVTPEHVPTSGAPARKKTSKAPRETSDVEHEDETPKSRRSREPQDMNYPTDTESSRRSKTRSVKADDDDAEPRRATAKQKDPRSESKPSEPASERGKVHKPLPPKRQPINETAESERKGINLEALKYLGAIAALVVVIVGLGMIIQHYGGNVGVDSNPFATAPDPQTAHQAAVVVGDTKPKPGETNPAQTSTTNPDQAAGTNTTKPKPANTPPEFDVEAIPAWANKNAEPTGLPILTVGSGAKTASHFPSLDEALRAVSGTGAILKLIGGGPFVVSNVELAGIKRLVLMAATSQDKPVVTLKPSEGQTTAGITLSGGTLEVRGLNFTLDRNLFAAETEVLHVVDGQLHVIQTSFSATGPDAVPTTAMVMSSTQDSNAEPTLEPSLLVDRVVVRGDGLRGLAVRRANVDAVVRDSLMVTGSAAALEMAGKLSAGVADVQTVKPRRIVRIVRSTLYGRRSLFDMASSTDSGAKPPRTDMVLTDTLCCAQGATENSSLILAAEWPQVRSITDGWLTRLRWVSKASLYLGFEQLIDLGADSSFKVNDATTWQRVWNAKYDSKQFHKLSFPDSAPTELSAVTPSDFDLGGLTYREIKTSSGGLPGCAVDKLIVPDSIAQQRATVMAMRPRVPTTFLKPVDPASIRKVDLKKQDLGSILNAGDWPSGTMFEVSGNGLCVMTPAKIEGKAVRLFFRQIDGTPLKLQAKTSDAKAPDASAIISITRGSLEVTNAVIEGSPSGKPSAPPWLLQAIDSSLVLNGCRLHGSEVDGPHQQGLVRWQTTPPASATAAPPIFFCRDSYLTGFGSGIRVESAHGQVILRNSVIAIRGDGLDLRPVRVDSALLTAVDVEHVSFSTSGAAFRVQAAAGSDEPVTSPLRLFVERTAFVPPLAFKVGEAAQATVVKCEGPVLEQKQLEWWGNSNGVAKQVTHLIHREGDPATASDKTGTNAWHQAWGRHNDVRLLVGEKGVYLLNDLPNKWKDLRPTTFDLHKTSQAATWAEGRPIGANVRGVEETSLAKKSGPETIGGAKPATTNPSIPNKKNVGF